jgi:hypothetical protein
MRGLARILLLAIAPERVPIGVVVSRFYLYYPADDLYRMAARNEGTTMTRRSALSRTQYGLRRSASLEYDRQHRVDSSP